MKKRSGTLFGDQDIEKLIGELLRYGVLISCAIACLGGFLYLLHEGHAPIPDYGKFKGEPSSLTTLPSILKGLVSLSSREIIQFGVIVLIATPILRIVLSLISFIAERDKMYILITLIVLTVMTISMFGGLKI